VLLLLFKEADVSTLAVLGRVSRDFSEASSPILYGSVVITSVSQLEALFCERKRTQRVSSTRFLLSLFLLVAAFPFASSTLSVCETDSVSL